MNRHEMEAKIGSGVSLRTLARRERFDLRAEDRGMVFVPASTGIERHTQWRGLDALYDKWVEAGMHETAKRLEDAAAETGGAAVRNSSYVLAAFHFFAGRIEAQS